MRIKVLSKTDNELRLEIEGESHTLCNLLEKVLLEDKTVDMAGYTIPHPLTSNPIVYIRTKGDRRTEMALKDAVDRVLQMEKEFTEEFQRALEDWKEERKTAQP